MNPFAAFLDTAVRGIRPQRSYDSSVLNFNGNTYPLGLNQTMAGKAEEIDGSFVAFANQAYKSNGIVFACMMTRFNLFSEARFAYQELRKGIPGDLFSLPSLDILNGAPWPNGTTGDLLRRASIDVDLAGNNYYTRRDDRIRWMRPDWVSIMLGSDRDPAVDARDIDAEVIGYVYWPGGKWSGKEPEILLPEQVSHFAPIPDPLAHFRGMSWLTPIVREIQGDLAANDFKNQYYANGATPNMIINFDASIKQEAFDLWVKKFKAEHEGLANAYKTAYLGAGATATVVGNQMGAAGQDFRAVQAAGEVRIAAASGIHPTIIGLSETLSGASINDGNFKAAARLTADRTLRPLWRDFAGSLASIVPSPPASRLWYDDSQIPFLKDDQKDNADIQVLNAQAITALVREGFDPDEAVMAVMAGDLRRLKGNHSGMISVQLHTPGEGPTPELPAGPPPPKQIPATTQKSADAASEVRCSSCDKKLADFASVPYRMTCPRCKTVTSAGLAPDVSVERAGPDMGGLLAALLARDPVVVNIRTDTPLITED